LKEDGKMKGIRNAVLALVCGAFLAGCSTGSAIVERIENRFGLDLEKTSDLARRYNKPEVAQCSDFLLATLRAQDGARAQLDALLKEETEGILSAALKAALIAELGRSLADQDKSQFEADFRENCDAVAGDIMIKLLRDAAKVGARVR
jgi:hypothetical protein